MSYGVISFVSFPFYVRTLYPFGKKPKYLECRSFSVSDAFGLDIGVEKEPKRPELSENIEMRLKEKKNFQSK